MTYSETGFGYYTLKYITTPIDQPELASPVDQLEFGKSRTSQNWQVLVLRAHFLSSDGFYEAINDQKPVNVD